MKSEQLGDLNNVCRRWELMPSRFGSPLLSSPSRSYRPRWVASSPRQPTGAALIRVKAPGMRCVTARQRSPGPCPWRLAGKAGTPLQSNGRVAPAVQPSWRCLGSQGGFGVAEAVPGEIAAFGAFLRLRRTARWTLRCSDYQGPDRGSSGAVSGEPGSLLRWQVSVPGRMACLCAAPGVLAGCRYRGIRH